MKKISKLSIFLAILFTLCSLFVSCNKKPDSNLTQVRLCEVVRSVFYAPMYIALEKGYFEEEGLSIDLSTGHADNTQMR